MFLDKNNKNLRANYEDYLPLWAKISFNQLALYGTHIGHSLKNLTPYSAWMVLGSRQGLCLIDMFKFIYMFRGGLFIIQALIRRRSPIWFVNLDQSSQSIIKSAAKECGEYWINQHWINGLLTNFRRITKAARNTMKMPRILWTSRQHNLTQNFRHWSLTRYTWPRAIFVSNVLASYNICQEAMHLRIPTMGIVDTNSPQKYVNMAIPGNDESFSSVGFYNNLVSMFILYNKFTMINLWYINRLSYIKKNSYANLKSIIFNVENYACTLSTKTKIDLNQFVLTSPVSNIKYGMLKHYQDIWKNRGIQLMYDLSVSNTFSRKNLMFDIISFYNQNQIGIHTLKNIYTYYKKWSRVFKTGRKNRKFKVRIGQKKNSKLYRHAWYFFQRGKISHARILRNQSFNFWKSIAHSKNPKMLQNITQIYRRYFKKVYWFPKSNVYNHRRSNIYLLLSSWFFVQFSCARILFSKFFYNSRKPLTSSIKQRRIALKRLQSAAMRKIKKFNYVNKFRFSKKYEGNFNDNMELENNNISMSFNLPKNIWYLKIMGLRHSLKKNTFLADNMYKNLSLPRIKKYSIQIDKQIDIIDTIAINKSTDNNCIKYVCNQWANINDISKTNNSNLNSYYYYNNNLDLFKPFTPYVYLSTFSNIRSYYVE